MAEMDKKPNQIEAGGDNIDLTYEELDKIRELPPEKQNPNLIKNLAVVVNAHCCNAPVIVI